jgi:hypothetical protein
MPVAWSSTDMSGGCAAGLSYNGSEIVAINARTNEKVEFVELVPEYPGPPGELEPDLWRSNVCTVTETPDPWGVAADRNSGFAYIASNSPSEPRPIDRYVTYTTDAEDPSPPQIALGKPVLRIFPNPFNPTTTIRCELPGAGHVRLEVFDLVGRKVATLVEGRRPAGRLETSWDASRLPGGVYFYLLRTEGGMVTRKAVLLK